MEYCTSANWIVVEAIKEEEEIPDPCDRKILSHSYTKRNKIGLFSCPACLVCRVCPICLTVMSCLSVCLSCLSVMYVCHVMYVTYGHSDCLAP